MTSQCKAISKRSGTRCPNRAAPGAKGFCRTHYKSQAIRRQTSSFDKIKDKALLVSAVASAATAVLKLIESVSAALSTYAGVFFRTGIPYDFRHPSERGAIQESMELIKNSPHGLLGNRDKSRHIRGWKDDAMPNQEQEDQLAIEAWKKDMSLLTSKAAALAALDQNIVPDKALQEWHEARDLLNKWISFVPNWTLESETVKKPHSAMKELSKSLDDLIGRYQTR